MLIPLVIEPNLTRIGAWHHQAPIGRGSKKAIRDVVFIGTYRVPGAAGAATGGSLEIAEMGPQVVTDQQLS